MSAMPSPTSKAAPSIARVERLRGRSYTRRNPSEVVQEYEVDMPRVKPLQHGRLRSSAKPHYYRIFLWDTQEDYEAALGIKGKETIAMCCTDTWQHENGMAMVKPKLGEIHFVSGTWSLGTVAHELTHAVLHRLRYLEPGPERVLCELREGHDPEDEEVIAYEMGDWYDAVVHWLQTWDPRTPYPGLHLRD